jgi:predicted permease
MSLISSIFGRSRLFNDLNEEMRLHIEERTEQLMREGVSQQEAERQALVAFGNPTLMEERSRVVWQWPTVESIAADVRLCLRQLRKSPGFTVAAVLTLTLAIGANAVVFGIMDGLILRPLNVPQADTLYGTQYGDGSGFQSYPNYLDLRARNHSFDDVAAFNFNLGLGLDTGNDPSEVNAFAVTGNYFDVLRMQPMLGRFFHASDEHGPGSAPYIVLTQAFWHTRFNDDPKVVGRVVGINHHPFTIIGVAPKGLQGTILFVAPDFFLPVVNQDQVVPGNSLNARENTHALFEVFGHLKPGVTVAQANADVNAVGIDLQKAYPKQVSHAAVSLAHVGLTAFAGPAKAFVAGLMLLAGLILLAACANLGSLFAARAADRGREMALRLALGSSRKRILRQLFTEAMLISVAGGALGLGASVALLKKISVWQPISGTPLHIPVMPDARLYWYSLALALVSGFLFGIVPVRQVLKANPYEIVKAGSSARMGRRITVRDVLLVIQISICAVLVTSSMVAVRGLMSSMHSNYGFDPHNAMTAGVNLAMDGYTLDTALPMQRRMIEAMQSIPGVESAGLVNGYPPLVYTAANRENAFNQETSNLIAANAMISPFRYEVSPGYFDAAGTTLLAGRSFSWQDDAHAPGVAIINRHFAEKIFGSVTGAIGRNYKLQDGTLVQVVGVAEDGKYVSLTEDQEPAMFLPFMQSPEISAYLVVRSHRDPQQLATAMRSKMRELDGALPVDLETYTQLLDTVLFPAKAATMALGVLGFMGGMLAVTGIFGMAAYSVSKRLRELGIRMALGAKKKEVLQAALARPLKLLVIGSASGLILGLLATKVLAYIVYQATPRDPFVLAGVVLAMLLLGLVATWIPAQRALSVNPLILLRED